MPGASASWRTPTAVLQAVALAVLFAGGGAVAGTGPHRGPAVTARAAASGGGVSGVEGGDRWPGGPVATRASVGAQVRVVAPVRVAARARLAAPGAARASGPAGHLAGTVSGRGTRRPSVTCRTDLSLADAPGDRYSFMCEDGGAPVSWPSGDVTVYEGALAPVQSAAFATAVVEWERAAHFSVAFTSDPGSADVSVISAVLTSGQPGYTEDGYTTVSYRCAPRCVYYHAAVMLSSSASLTARGWTSTILHELGHVAGLNHVERRGEVMYPYLTDVPPVAYTDGDRAGFAALAAKRAR